jgi:hypothetical protein
MAKREKQLGKTEGFERCKQKTDCALEVVRSFLTDRLLDDEVREAIQSRCLDLERAIAEL